MFFDAFGYRCEGRVIAEFRFHAVLSLSNGSAVRPAATFPDFTLCKRGVPSAHEAPDQSGINARQKNATTTTEASIKNHTAYHKFETILAALMSR